MKPVVSKKMRIMVPMMVILFAFTCFGTSALVYGQQSVGETATKAMKGAAKELLGTEAEAEKKAAEPSEEKATDMKQPQMEKTLKALETAKTELNKASADKGGHRAKALNLIDQAINEVNLGIEYAKTKNKK
ncbi:MAG: hypothetical protein ACLFUU_04105 [Desulfobacteraceae bacterium]